MSVSKMCASGVFYDIQGESKKMSVSEKGSLITNGHFFDSPSSSSCFYDFNCQLIIKHLIW